MNMADALLKPVQVIQVSTLRFKLYFNEFLGGYQNF